MAYQRCHTTYILKFLAVMFNILQMCSCFKYNSIIGHSCGDVKKRSSGMIQSPHLPKSFSRAVLCTWKIIVPEVYNEIYIYLWMSGDKKLTYDLTHCLSDHLAINQIIDGRAEKRAKYCGKQGFFRTRTFGREAEVRFWLSPSRRNNVDGRTAFRLLWFATKGCSSAVHGRRGIIQSPNYPNNYPSDTFCKWHLSTPFKKGIIKMRFVKFDLQGHSPRCKKDYVIIKDGKKKSLGIFCGRDAVKELIVEGDSATIMFKSNKRKNFPGFKIEWSSEYKINDDKTCGMTNFLPQLHQKRQRRYVGGQIAKAGSMPWLAQIVASQFGNSVSNVRQTSCGGALIGSKWVLTAAHCVVPMNKLSYQVYLGGQGNRDVNAKMATVRKVHVHPAYLGSLTNDVALLELEEHQSDTHFIRTICLPDSDAMKHLDSEATCWMGGWGKSNDGFSSNTVLYSQLKYKGHCLFRPDIICAESPEVRRKIGPCDGDSGGPLFCQMAKGRFFIAGILTHGPKLCGTHQDYYADISFYGDWIQKVLGENVHVNSPFS